MSETEHLGLHSGGPNVKCPGLAVGVGKDALGSH